MTSFNPSHTTIMLIMSTQKLNLISNLLIYSLLVLSLPLRTAADDVCPYPCFPPPTGAGGSTTPTPTPTTPTTPPPPSTTGYYQHPPPPPPPYSGGGGGGGGGGGVPYYYPPPYSYGYGGGGYGGGVAPPPPDPILPYFPFYFKNGLHKDQSVSASSVPAATISRLLALVVIFAFFFAI